METITDEHQQEVKKTKLPLPAVLGIGCLVVLVLSLLTFGIAFAVAGKLIFSPLGENFLKKTIEQKTGMKFENNKNGNNIIVTNQKTGETVEVGEGKIPANFPKDFPLYPGAVPKGLVASAKQTASNGFWLLLESKDALSTVNSWYADQLEAKGWILEETNSVGDGTMYKVKKDKLIGNVILSKDSKDEKSTILITLEPTNEQNPAPQEVAPEGAEPIDEP